MSGKRYERALVWFRRDLRDFDHAALHHALRAADAVHCAFVFDREILEALDDPADRRVEFFHDSVVELAASLAQRGGALIVRHARARDEIPRLAAQLRVGAVFANRDYEPQARDRDAAVAHDLAAAGIAFHDSKDQVIFERDEVLTQSGKPFAVFTPYKNAWLSTVTPFFLRSYPVEHHAAALAKPPRGIDKAIPTLEAMGLRRTNLRALSIGTGMSGGAALFRNFRKRIDAYRAARDFPAVDGPSYLSVHLRFGTVSIRELAA